jgi:CheY-like chemotaxis protein/anti-sigma regulatory factor (Ser/Thr protein kinase)
MVKRNMALLSNIVLDMLSYTKNRKPSVWACEVNELCEDVVALLEGQAAESGVALATDLARDVVEVELDAAAIKRCLINLVGNAVDACGQTGGSVTVQTRLLDRPGFFAIRVSDTGCGIESGLIEKIFDPFYSTKGNRGTGLGLAVTKKIVEEHQGVLRVDSTPGKGTVFAMELPVRQQSEPQAAQTNDPEQEEEVQVMPKVLVVDDEPDAREFVSAILEAEGWEVAQAEDGKAGLAAARSDKPDLIVLDVQMPKMDGFAVFAELIKDPKLKGVKVVMLTGIGEKVGIRFSKSSMGEFLGKEPAGYAEKPIDPEVFKRLVKKVTAST